MFACLFGSAPGLVELAQAFSPLVEPVSSDTVIFSVTGLGRLIGDAHDIASAIARRGEETGCTASLAIAAKRGAAILAARNFPGVTIMAVGKEAETLAPLPVETLAAAPELTSTLLRWGIRTLGALAELPEIGLVERLGEEGRKLWLLAQGHDVSILDIRPVAPDYSERQEFEDAVETLEPLLFILNAQLRSLTDKLQRDGQATNRITIILDLDPGSFERIIDLPVPMRETPALLKQIQLALEAHPPSAPVIGARIMLAPAVPRALQGGLFLPAAPEPERLHTLLARLRALVGEDEVGTPEILNSHRPDAWRFRPCAFEAGVSQHGQQPDMQLAFRYFRPPLNVRVRLERGAPKNIVSPTVSGEVLLAAGPWRSSGGWVDAVHWNRDEWDIVLADKAIYRIYRTDGTWFLDGTYD